MLRTLSLRVWQKCQKLHSSRLPSVRNDVFCRYASRKTELDEFSILTEETNLIQIDGYYSTGFKIRGILVEGAVICFQDLWLQWKVQTMEDLTPVSLCFLRLFRPLPDLLVLGCGPSIRPLPTDIVAMLRELHIRVECIDSINATSTFNLLNQEGRTVVGALLPLSLEKDETGDGTGEVF